MTRLIARLQISSACMLLGLLVAPAGAVAASDYPDQSVRSASQDTEAAPADSSGQPAAPSADAAAPSADAAPSASGAAPQVENLPPGTAAPLPSDQAAVSDAGQAAPPGEGGPPCATQCDDGEWHPLAAWRAQFAAMHCAPARFPYHDGQPRPVVVPGARVVAFVQSHPVLGDGGGSGMYMQGQFAQPEPQPGQVVASGQPVNFQTADGGPVVEGSQAGDGTCEMAGQCSTGQCCTGQCCATECCPNQCCSGECYPDRCGSWYGGGDYYFIRPHQTYDTAYQLTPNGATGVGVTNVNFNPTFGSALRLFAGYEMSCDESLQFSYTYIFNDTERTEAVPTASTILTPLGATLAPGDTLTAIDHVLVNAWDIDDVRRLNLPWCDCRSPWDVKWSWGVRVLRIDESVLDSVSGPDAGPFAQKSSYLGAGPRLGIDMHRHLGQSKFSAYAKANAALLVGEEKTYGPTTPSGTKGVQAVPDIDLQLGLGWQPTCRLSFTAGYLFEYFGDATTLSDASGLALVTPPTTSNLSFDGLFVRGEFRY